MNVVIVVVIGGFKSKDAPYVVPSGTILGVITGLLLVKFAFLRL